MLRCSSTMLRFAVLAVLLLLFLILYFTLSLSKGRKKEAGWLYLFVEVFLVLLDRSGWEHKMLFVLCVMGCVCGN